MQGKRFIQTLRLQNLLSYGSEGKAIALEPLNVLIGPNASGKSNLIEAIGLLRAAPRDLAAAIRAGGGIGEWLWKGGKDTPIAEIETAVEYPPSHAPLRYRICFTAVGQRLDVVDESAGNKMPLTLNRGADFKSDQSILSRQAPAQHPELAYLGSQFSNICLYRVWNLGSDAAPKKPQRTDLPEHPLLEDASNLGLALNNLQYQLGAGPIIENLRKFYGAAEELITTVYGGTLQIFVRERGAVQPIPAARLSDGTLHYLCLLALLLDPTPPPLVCIEEPEVGLHPDILPTVADLLIEASQRTQLIVTTHSADLVSAFSPDAVLVCERDEEEGSHLRRLDPESLEVWLKDFSLGHLWQMGEIGGTRW